MQRLSYEDYIWQHTPKLDLKQKNVLHFYPTPEIPGDRDLLGHGSGLVVCRCDPRRRCQRLLRTAGALSSPSLTARGPTKLPEPGNGHPSSKGCYLCHGSNLSPARREQVRTCPSDSPTATFHSM